MNVYQSVSGVHFKRIFFNNCLYMDTINPDMILLFKDLINC